MYSINTLHVIYAYYVITKFSICVLSMRNALKGEKGNFAFNASQWIMRVNARLKLSPSRNA